MIDQLVQYDDNGSTLPPSKTTVRKRSNHYKKRWSHKLLICDDCPHNTITYEPSKDGTCECGCH
jgi:TPP-dependent indolepyruvate ferredoxin oxidoreductase alpha subunit